MIAKELILKKVGEFMHRNWKWLIVLTFSIAVLLVWDIRFKLINVQDNTSNFIKISISVLYVLIAVFFLFVLVKSARAPLLQRMRFKRGFRKMGFHNSEWEFPLLISKRFDKNKEHGVVYKLKTYGKTAEDFDRNVKAIEPIVKGRVYRITYAKNMNRILLYVIPKKHDKPRILSCDSKDLCLEPNFLCVGKTGSGKSCALLTLLGIYANHIPNVSITICDYKKSSFASFDDTPNFYGYNNVSDGIKAFYKEFETRLEANDAERNKQLRVLVIDEYGALVAAQDKKLALEIKTMVGNMLFMGRSLGMRILIGVQRADALLFMAGAREQFRAILALGNLTKEQKQMLFSGDKDKLTDINDIGEGYLHIDGQDVERVKVAQISDFGALNENIRQAMYH